MSKNLVALSLEAVKSLLNSLTNHEYWGMVVDNPGPTYGIYYLAKFRIQVQLQYEQSICYLYRLRNKRFWTHRARLHVIYLSALQKKQKNIYQWKLKNIIEKLKNRLDSKINTLIIMIQVFSMFSLYLIHHNGHQCHAMNQYLLF